ncbi:MAG: hypothetical protein QS721_00400 [Candidatus Endonucleobacter sp. (ex Gigantidas childressi)]|nr:hypothetical protein [Candidatus Endonucleobacter sp. (ex Gigantidas childressi)]
MKRALMRLNSRPKKDLNFKTPTLIMGEHRAAMMHLEFESATL